MPLPQPPHKAIVFRSGLKGVQGQTGMDFPPPSAPNQTSQLLSHSSDTSVPLFTLYLRQDHDGMRLELLKADTDQILVFCGLFSATVAALIVPWMLDTTAGPPDPYRHLANSCWLFGLLISISCALMALSLQRWAQPRIMVTSLHYSLLEQARLRMFFAAGIEKLNITFLVEFLHCLVHISFAVFLFGLFLYLKSIDFVIALITYIWITLSIGVYAYFTLMPIFRPGYPGSTPFSNVIAIACAGVSYGTFRLLYLVTSLIRVGKATQGAVHQAKDYFRDWNLGLMWLAQVKAQKLARQLDGNVLKRTLDMLRSDDDLEQFFEAIPGFFDSQIVDDPRRSLDILGQQRLAETLVQFWNRTLSSIRVSESVKGRRLIVCLRVIEAADLSFALPRILHLFSMDHSGVSRSVEMGHSLGVLRNGDAALLARGIIAHIIAINDERDERWFTLAMDELGIPEDVLRRYLDHGDSVLLANLIHITRQFFQNLLQRGSGLTEESLRILPSVSKFDIRNTLPELQHDFCALWNEIVQQVQSKETSSNPFIDILVEVRGLYVALHGVDVALTYFFASTASQDSEDLLRRPASYPLCMMSDHHRHLTSHIPEADGSTTGEASHSTITASPALLSKSSPGDVLDVPQHVPTLDPSPSSGRHDPIVTATVIVQGIVNTSESLSSSMAQPIARSPPGTGDAPQPDGEITGLESPSSVSANALTHTNPQVATIVLDQSVQTELIHHPGESGPSVILVNQDRDSSENMLTSQQPN